jgi:hypothetical protein
MTSINLSKIIVSLVLLTSLAAHSDGSRSEGRNRNPTMRVCRLVGGSSWVVTLNNEESLSCRFGEAVVSGYDLFIYKSTGKVSSNIGALLSRSTNTGVCSAIKLAEDLDGTSVELCEFSDGSYLSTITLVKGLDHADNEKLNEALSIQISNTDLQSIGVPGSRRLYDSFE